MTTTKKNIIIETLLNWGRENGIRTHPNVAIKQRIIKNGDEDDEEDERGIFYERLDDERDDVNDVNDDATTTTTETLVSIPEKALLCVPRGRTETTTKRLEEEEDDALCKILLRESRKIRTTTTKAAVVSGARIYERFRTSTIYWYCGRTRR